MTGLVCSSLISLSYYWFYSILILILLNHFIPGVHDLRLPEHAAKRNVIYSRLQRIMDMNRTSHEYTFDTRCINHLVHVNLKWSRNLTSFCHSFFSLFFLPLLICSKFFSWRVNINIYFAIWAIGLMVLWSKLFLLVYLPVLFRLCDYLTFVNHDWKSRESKKKNTWLSLCLFWRIVNKSNVSLFFSCIRLPLSEYFYEKTRQNTNALKNKPDFRWKRETKKDIR